MQARPLCQLSLGPLGTASQLALAPGSLRLIGASICVVALALPSSSSEDPPNIVLDEVAGQLLTHLALPLVPKWAPFFGLAVFAGFVLFQMLDTMKPYWIWKLGHWSAGQLAGSAGHNQILQSPRLKEQ